MIYVYDTVNIIRQVYEWEDLLYVIVKEINILIIKIYHE